MQESRKETEYKCYLQDFLLRLLQLFLNFVRVHFSKGFPSETHSFRIPHFLCFAVAKSKAAFHENGNMNIAFDRTMLAAETYIKYSMHKCSTKLFWICFVKTDYNSLVSPFNPWNLIMNIEKLDKRSSCPFVCDPFIIKLYNKSGLWIIFTEY